MNLLNETLYFIVIATGVILIYKGTNPLLKVVAGHVPMPSGLREAIAA